jgi:catechol 2,3-dioxygenase
MVSIPSATQITDVCLRVRDLDTVADFYRGVLGFKDLVSRSGEKRLSASGNEPAQIVLIEDRQAAPCRLSAPGLFHNAFLFPSRHALSAVLRHLVEKEIRIHGFADHGVSEAVYLADSEGNGVELYRDRPKETWMKSGGEVAMVTEPLDVGGLLRESGSGSGITYELDPGTALGHIHLQVSDLEKAEMFYHRLLGFDVTQRSYPGALFVSAGGYHHHLGFNIWSSRNCAPTPGTTGLISFGIHIPDLKAHEATTVRLQEHGISVHWADRDFAEVRDSDNITIHLTN